MYAGPPYYKVNEEFYDRKNNEKNIMSSIFTLPQFCLHIILTVAEYHSAIVPWQFVAKKTSANFLTEEVLDAWQLLELLSRKTKLVVVHHVSNVHASALQIVDIVHSTHGIGAKVFVDACQSVPHMAVDVQSLGVDFVLLLTRLGCSVIYLSKDKRILQITINKQCFRYMISDIYLAHFTYVDHPCRFEAGTPAILEAIRLGATIDYLSGIGMQKVHDYEVELADYLYERLSSILEVRIYSLNHLRLFNELLFVRLVWRAFTQRTLLLSFINRYELLPRPHGFCTFDLIIVDPVVRIHTTLQFDGITFLSGNPIACNYTLQLIVKSSNNVHRSTCQPIAYPRRGSLGGLKVIKA
ncbi:LOW QUALITY PROTEIN: hypothetical protein Cgig2_009233 [Carnegiea gigantea]|uniref:Aminotransferase class V domain-containing protein n=1 Tax=Carnegiea gigantea TaxID=171969 RepID=A0A9Q1KA05_9CARY|nr:LOW QUALITY PROTEIN: hypothetical protein Cgig2_009233 [Carnegiea gigantea]